VQVRPCRKTRRAHARDGLAGFDVIADLDLTTSSLGCVLSDVKAIEVVATFRSLEVSCAMTSTRC